jgi:hypothetical protein
VNVRRRWEVRLAYIAGGGDPAKLSSVDYDQRARLRAEIYMAQLRVERARAGAQDGPDVPAALRSLELLEELARKLGLEPYAGGVLIGLIRENEILEDQREGAARPRPARN